jgi:hypothetical protein
MQNLGTLRQLSLGDLAIMPILMATSLRWRMHSAQTKIDPLIITGAYEPPGVACAPDA